MLRGIRAHLVYYSDDYVGSDERERVMGNVTFEHPYINGEFDYLEGQGPDRWRPRRTCTVRAGRSGRRRGSHSPTARRSEALLRYDHFIRTRRVRRRPRRRRRFRASRC